MSKYWQLLNSLGIAGAVSVLVAQPAWTQVIQVTQVRLNPTDRGLEIILEFPSDRSPQFFTTSFGKTFVADIINTQLRLPNGQDFRADNPAAGIASVTVTQQNANSIRVTVTGTTDVPKVQLNPSDRGLVLSLSAAADTTADLFTPTLEAPDSEITEDPDERTQESAVAAEEEEIEIVVTAEQEEGYQVDSATTATRTDTLLRNVPQSIQVVPQQVIEDQQATQLQDALRNVSGVQPGPNQINASNLETYYIRGFEQGNLFRNGFPTRSTGPQDLAGVERVEVLKGPASVLYGQIEPGGIINVVTKKPLSNPFYSAQMQIGSYQFYRPSLDISGPLNEDRSLLYRLNTAYTNSESFRDFVESERIFVAPALTVKFSEDTSVTFDLEYLDDDRTWDSGVPAIGDRPGDVPISRFFNEPDGFKRVEDLFAGYALEHNFSENWQLRNAFRYHNYQLDREYFELDGVQEDNRTLNRSYLDETGETEEFSLVTDVVGEFATGDVDHVLLVGLDLRRQELRNVGGFAEAAAINIFNPIYGSPIPTDLE